MIDILYPEEFSKMSEKDKFDFYFKQAQLLYNTRYEPFENSKEEEWYGERLFECVQNYMKYKEAEMLEEKETLKLSDVMFVTFSPRDEVTLKKAHQAVEDFCHKKKIKKYIYVIEQRGVTEKEIHGYHFHILHTHEYDRASHYKRETQSSFRKYCKIQDYQIFNMSPCKTDIDIHNRLIYMIREKQDLPGNPKRLKQQIDKIMRKKYFLKDYYTNDFTHWEKYL